MRSLRGDRRGVLGMPARLAVAFLIVALCVPVLVEAVDSFREDSDLSLAGREADRIAGAAASVHYQDEGSSVLVDVDVPGGCELVIDPDSDPYGIGVVRHGELKDTVRCTRPALTFVGDSLTVTGPATLRVSSAGSNEVEVVLDDRVHDVPRGPRGLRGDTARGGRGANVPDVGF